MTDRASHSIHETSEVPTMVHHMPKEDSIEHGKAPISSIESDPNDPSSSKIPSQPPPVAWRPSILRLGPLSGLAVR